MIDGNEGHSMNRVSFSLQKEARVHQCKIRIIPQGGIMNEIFEKRKKIIYEFICDEFYVPMKLKELAMLLQVPKDQRDALKEVMDSLEAEGKVHVTQKGKYVKGEGHRLVGIFQAHAKGFGFVTIEGEEEDIFISIDDNEVAQLKCLCDEVFNTFTDKARTNCLGVLVWNLGTGTQAGHFTRAHEYVLAYAVNKDKVSNFTGGSGEIDHSALKKISKKNPPVIYTFKAGAKFLAPNGTELFDEWGGSEKTRLLDGRMVAENGKLKYDVTLEAGFAMIQQMKTWYNGEYTIDSKGQHVTEFYFNSTGVLHYKKERSIINPPSVINDCGSTKAGSIELANILGSSDTFGYPKPVQLIKYLISFKSKDQCVTVLDFFAGSGTTLHATMQLNAEDGGHRQCILVTNNENGICENVTYERNRRVIQGYTTPKGEKVPGLTRNNLRYYKTKFVPRDKSPKNLRNLMALSTDMLCIHNDTYIEKPFAGKNINNKIARYFESNDGTKRMLVIYRAEAIQALVELMKEEFKNAESKENGKLMVYVFSPNGYAYDDEFEDVAEYISLCAMPDAVLNAYRRVLPKKHQVQLLDDVAEETDSEARTVEESDLFQNQTYTMAASEIKDNREGGDE